MGASSLVSFLRECARMGAQARRRVVGVPPWRRAKTGDIPAIEALLTADKLPLEGVKENIAGFFVIYKGRRLVAAIGLESYSSAGLLRSAVVASDMRDKGLGRFLVERVILEARAKGWDALFLLTETAQGYFAKFGFVAVDRSEVPPDVTGSVEFQGACPVNATVMRLKVSE